MNINEIRKWKHITKLDPDKKISEKNIEKIVNSDSDAIMVSGTLNVTKKNVSALLSVLKRYDIPKILEPPSPECIIDGFDYLFIPSVINTDDAAWIIGKHKKWIQKYQIDWDRIVPEAYIVLNPESDVGRTTKAKTKINEKEITSYAICAEKFFKFPIIYIEYSGRYGNPEIVKSVSKNLESSILFYGGGINSEEKASEMLKYADVVVVGNIFYENLEEGLKTVVR